jgi:predicted CoA-binding protein
MPFENPDDEVLRQLLTRARRVAVVGLSPKPDRDSHRVASYLQQHGYQIDPVYPREEQILGRTVYRRVQDLPTGVDVVDVFRRGEELPEVVDDVLAAGGRAVWFQLGCVNEAAAERARQAGLTVVLDRCMKIEHSRLVAASGRRA